MLAIQDGDVVLHLLGRGHFRARNHLEAVRLDLVDDRAKVRHREADVVHRRADGAAGRRLHGPEEDQDVRELDDFLLIGAELHHRSAERVDEELLLRVHVRRVQVVVAVDDRAVLGDEQLGRGRRRDRQTSERPRNAKTKMRRVMVGDASTAWEVYAMAAVGRYRTRTEARQFSADQKARRHAVIAHRSVFALSISWLHLQLCNRMNGSSG